MTDDRQHRSPEQAQEDELRHMIDIALANGASIEGGPAGSRDLRASRPLMPRCWEATEGSWLVDFVDTEPASDPV